MVPSTFVVLERDSLRTGLYRPQHATLISHDAQQGAV
jgi:hypothetical protein